MADLDHWWGDDISLDPSGDLALVESFDKDNQSIFRRLCTNGANSGAGLAEYIWEPNYGGSAPWYVGRLTDQLAMSALIRSQMYMEATVSHNPEPSIAVTINPNGTIMAVIQYVNNSTGLKSLPLQINLA